MEDEGIMGLYAAFLVEKESLTMLSTFVKTKMIDAIQLKFYEEKYNETLLMINCILEDKEQKEMNLNEENIQKTFKRIYK